MKVFQSRFFWQVLAVLQLICSAVLFATADTGLALPCLLMAVWNLYLSTTAPRS